MVWACRTREADDKCTQHFRCEMKRKAGKHRRRGDDAPNININVSEGEGVRCECKLGSAGLSGIKCVN